MGKDLSKKRIFNYVQAELPPDYFAVLRVEWHDENGILQSVDELKVTDNGYQTRNNFIKVAKNALLNGADISIITAYSPEYIGLLER